MNNPSQLAGTIIGAIITYHIQKGRQEREWKRQFNAVMLEQVYIKLYDGIDTVIDGLEPKTHDMELTTGWGSIRKDHRYVITRVQDVVFNSCPSSNRLCVGGSD